MQVNYDARKMRISSRQSRPPKLFMNEQANVRNAERKLAQTKKEKLKAGKNVTMAKNNVEKAKGKLKAAKKKAARAKKGKMPARNPNRNRSPHRANYYTNLSRQRSYNNPRRAAPLSKLHGANQSGVMILTPHQQRQANMYTQGFRQYLNQNVFAVGPSRNHNSSSSNSNSNSNINLNFGTLGI